MPLTSPSNRVDTERSALARRTNRDREVQNALTLGDPAQGAGVDGPATDVHDIMDEGNAESATEEDVAALEECTSKIPMIPHPQSPNLLTQILTVSSLGTLVSQPPRNLFTGFVDCIKFQTWLRGRSLTFALYCPILAIRRASATPSQYPFLQAGFYCQDARLS